MADRDKTVYFIGGSRDLSKQVVEEAGREMLRFAAYDDASHWSLDSINAVNEVTFKTEQYRLIGRLYEGWIYQISTVIK